MTVLNTTLNENSDDVIAMAAKQAAAWGLRTVGGRVSTSGRQNRSRLTTEQRMATVTVVKKRKLTLH